MAKPSFAIKGPGLKRLAQMLDAIQQTTVKVGVLEKAGNHRGGDDDVTVAQVAYWNEYGTENAPPRPAFRLAMEQNNATITQALERATKVIVDSTTKSSTENPKSVAKKTMSQVGLLVQGMIQQSITDLKDPPNAPRTIAMKGSSNPLIDSGQYRKSITYAVVTGAEAKAAREESEGPQ